VGSIDGFAVGFSRGTVSDSSPSFPIGPACLSIPGPISDHDAMSGISAPKVRNIPAVGNAHGLVEGIKGPEEYHSLPDAGPMARHPGANGVANIFFVTACVDLGRWPRLGCAGPLALESDDLAGQENGIRR